MAAASTPPQESTRRWPCCPASPRGLDFCGPLAFIGTWTVTLAGATLGGGDGGNYVLDSVAMTTAKITPKALAGSATTQGALNVAKDGTVSFRIDLDKSGIVDGQTVAQLFNGAWFRLTVGGQTYSIRAQAVACRRTRVA